MKRTAKSILLIEDEPMVRSLLARYLRKSGAQIKEAASVAQGLEAYRLQPHDFDVVVTDVHLPDGSGLDLAISIRELHEGQPIVFVTGDVDEQLARAALDTEGAGYLLKPFEFFELDAAIQQAVRTTELPSAPPASPAATPAHDKAWQEQQRGLLETAARKPVELRLVSSKRSHFDVRFVLRAALVVVVVLLVALAIGYATGPDDAPPAVVPEEVIIQPPSQQPPPRQPAAEPRDRDRNPR